MRLLILFWMVLSWAQAAEVLETEDFRRETVGTPLDVSAHRVVGAYFDWMESFDSLKPVTLGEVFELEQQYKAKAAMVADHILSEKITQEFAAFYEASDETVREALRPVVRDIIAVLNSRILAGEELSITSPRRMFRSYQPMAQYEYRLGRELKREVLDRYESIIRQTFFENKSHNVDIAADFLEPIRKVITTLKLKSMFEWLWDSKLFFGYHSSFTYHRKVFIRFKGYYQKTAVTVEVLRRKVTFFGSEPWEPHGSIVQMVEEPTAVVGREVQLLD